MEQQQRSVGLGVGAGIVAGIAGAAVWAIVTSAVNARIGYLALGVGAGVGFAVGRLGKGPVNGPLPIVAAVIALLAVYFGDLFGWAGQLHHDLSTKAGIDIGTFDLVKGVLTGHLDYQGEAVPIRAEYKDDFDFFVVFMMAIGVLAAFTLCRRQLEEAAQPTFPPPGVPGAPAPYGAPAGFAPPTGQPAPPSVPAFAEPPTAQPVPPAWGQPPAQAQPPYPPVPPPYPSAQPPYSTDGPPSFEKRPDA